MGCLKLTYCSETEIPSYRDHEKTTSKTEGTPIFGIGEKQGSDYYLFGMLMPGRTLNADDSRYGYHGMEQDVEVSGNGNSYTTEFRQYDPRLGRWKSLDPLMGMFPKMSPYNAFANFLTVLSPRVNHFSKALGRKQSVVCLQAKHHCFDCGIESRCFTAAPLLTVIDIL
jgi:RHS repeat-associated protein